MNTGRRGELAGLGQLWSLVTPGGGGDSLHLFVTWSRLESGLGADKCKELHDPGDRPERGAGGAGRDDPGLQGRDVHHGAGPRPRRPRPDQVTLASDWSEQVTWLNYWPLIGRDRSHDLYNGLLLVRNRRRASPRSRLGTDDQTGLAGHHQTGTRPCTGSNSSPSSWTPSCQSPSTSAKTWPDIM